MENLRYLIREVLKEELDNLKEKTKTINSPVKEEEVRIQSSLDLNNFAKRIMKMSQDPKINSELRTGKHIFRLSNHDQQPLVEAHQPISKMFRNDHNITFDDNSNIMSVILTKTSFVNFARFYYEVAG